MQPLLQSIKKHVRCILTIIHALLYFNKYNPPLLNQSIIFQKYVHVFKQTCRLDVPLEKNRIKAWYSVVWISMEDKSPALAHLCEQSLSLSIQILHTITCRY